MTRSDKLASDHLQTLELIITFFFNAQDLKKYFDSCNGDLDPETVKVRNQICGWFYTACPSAQNSNFIPEYLFFNFPIPCTFQETFDLAVLTLTEHLKQPARCLTRIPIVTLETKKSEQCHAALISVSARANVFLLLCSRSCSSY